MKNTTKYSLLLSILCGIGFCLFLANSYTYHLIHREQMLLFTYTSQQISQFCSHPAALSCLTGDFLTQFFHMNVMGPILVASTMALLQILTYFSCKKLTNDWIAIGISLVVVLWECLRFCDINYPLSGTISLIGALVLFLVTHRIKGRWTYCCFVLLATILGYVCFGYGAFIYGLLVILNNFIHRKKCVEIVIALACSLGAIAYMASQKYLMMPSKAFSYPATVWYGKPNLENERILGLNTEYYFNHWSKITELVYQGGPSNGVSVCYNLANAMQGKLPERLMQYYQPAGLGLFMPINEESTYLSTQLAGEIWFQLGDMTMAEHAAILSMIFSPNNKSVRMLQRMAEINLINGDNEAAEKYLQILSHTLFYKDWAAERMPGKESETFKKWLEYKRNMIPQSDTLRLSATDVTKSLHVLLETNPQNHLAMDYLLCFDLLMKDLSGFIKDYTSYYKGKPNRLYSEALMIHLFQIHATGKEVKATGMHPSVVRDFNAYSKLYNQSQGNASALESKFGRTYWFYYHFAKFE